MKSEVEIIKIYLFKLAEFKLLNKSFSKAVERDDSLKDLQAIGRDIDEKHSQIDILKEVLNLD